MKKVKKEKTQKTQKTEKSEKKTKKLTHKASWSFFTNSPHSGEKNAAMTTTVARGQY